MVTSVTSYSGSGLRDWLVQRVSAIVLAIYFVFLMGFFLTHPGLDFQAWYALFHHTFMKVTTLFVILMLALHAWVGIWTVLTDYVKPTAIRLSLQVLVAITLVGCFFWGLEILWGV